MFNIEMKRVVLIVHLHEHTEGIPLHYYLIGLSRIFIKIDNLRISFHCIKMKFIKISLFLLESVAKIYV